MATSHTGHLTGSDAVVSAVFRQYGITRVDGLDELPDTSAMFARAAHPGATASASTPSRAGRAPMADLAAAAGLCAARAHAGDQGALRQWIPDYLRVSNPVDNGGRPSIDWRGRKILDAIVADPDGRRAHLSDHRRPPVDEPPAGRGPRRRRGHHRQADLRDLGLAAHG